MSLIGEIDIANNKIKLIAAKAIAWLWRIEYTSILYLQLDMYKQ